MTNQAQIAIHAAKHKHIWGAFAARRYAGRHGVLAAYRLACQLEAASNVQYGRIPSLVRLQAA